nr:MAG TPA: hypothetical protein [Caudoviricetes sp.]
MIARRGIVPVQGTKPACGVLSGGHRLYYSVQYSTRC